VVTPTRVTMPSSTSGRRTSCWARLKRWISSISRSVFRPAVDSRSRAWLSISRSSLTVAVTAVLLSGTGQSSTYTSTGIVPAGTQYATFGIRAGTECQWPLPAQFSVSSFVLDAGFAGKISGDFSNGLTGWGQSGTPSLLQVINGNLEVLVNPGEMLNLNPDPIPFSAAGAPFTFSVNATIPIGSRGNACLVAIFLSATPAELLRVVIPLQPQPISVGSTLTATDGRFSVDLGSLPPVNLQLWADYPGSDALWPAATSIAEIPFSGATTACAALPLISTSQLS